LQIDDIVKRFGAKRLIFSTYYPVDDSQTSLMLITHGSFSMKDKEMIAHGNLENLIEGVQR
jgi:predicted TIM-barrel fold metal-dependent hydrolase